MAEDKPTAAFVLSLIAGIFILLNGLVVAWLGSLFAILGMEEIGIALIAVGMVFGVVVLLGAIMLYAQPKQHVVWGVIVLVLSLGSIIIGGGFFIGLILGLVGGILGIIWKPTAAGAMRICPRCGRQVALEYNVCPHCGNVFPGAPTPPMAPPVQ